MSSDRYGEPPISIAGYYLGEWEEFMHYLYLPVKMAGSGRVMLPQRLEFMRPIVHEAFFHAREVGFSPADTYVYVTARRGMATPDNPLNRPGWHCDGFGTDDLNYIWFDRWPTRFALGDFGSIDAGHVSSMEQFEHRIAGSEWDQDGRITVVDDLPTHQLYSLTPYVVHATPLVPSPGGLRSFLKISVSHHRYNLKGNSHNYLFDYDWPMHDRTEARNDPVYGEADFVPEVDR